MRKHLSYLTLIITAILLICSCNLDSNEGIIQSAATAVEVIPYKTKNVLGRNDSKNLLFVSTDKGICSVDGNGSYTVLKEGGNLANLTLLARDDFYVYFNEETKTFPAMSYDGSLLKDNFFPLFEGYTLKGVFSQNGLDFTYSLEKDGEYYTARFKNGIPPQNPIEAPAQISIIGDYSYVTTDSNGKHSHIIVNDVTYTVGDGNQARICGAIEKEAGVVYAVDIHGNVYLFDDENQTGKILHTSNISQKTNFIATNGSDKDNILFIIPGESSYGIINTSDNTISQYTNSALGSTIPHLIVGYSEDGGYLILNEDSGAYLLKETNFNAVKSSNSFILSNYK